MGSVTQCSRAWPSWPHMATGPRGQRTQPVAQPRRHWLSWILGLHSGLAGADGKQTRPWGDSLASLARGLVVCPALVGWAQG